MLGSWVRAPAGSRKKRQSYDCLFFVFALLEVLYRFRTLQVAFPVTKILTGDAKHRTLRREHAAAARAGQSENGLSENKARSKRNEQFAQRRIVHSSFFRLRGLLKNSIANSTELPSRRAGGGFGHPVRVVLSQINVIPKFMECGC